MGSAALVSFSFAVLTGCKDKDAAPDQSIDSADTSVTVDADTTGTTLNDSNVSGVTGGTMEQVP